MATVLRPEDGTMNWMILSSSYRRTAQRALLCEPRFPSDTVASNCERCGLRNTRTRYLVTSAKGLEGELISS
jgi:hypothetical protein